MDTTIRNQQQRLGWLAGVLESEGNISLVYGNHGKAIRRIQIVPRVQITNKDINLIQNALSIIKANECSGRISYDGKRPVSNGCYILLIEGMKRIQKFIEIIEPYLVTKRDRLELLKQFCKSRIDDGPRNRPYSSYEWYLFQQLRGLNGKGRNKEIDDHIQEMLRDYTPSSVVTEKI
jgi:hypothetical protein